MRKQNVTLAIDSAVLKNARKYALDHDTSVNQIIRDVLAGLGPQGDKLDSARNDLRKLFRKSRFEIGKKTWIREELHERR